MPSGTRRRSRDDDDDAPSSKTPWLLAILGVLVVLGCCIWVFFLRSTDDGGTVNGVVTLDGAVVAGAMVTFVLDDPKKESTFPGPTNDQGEYRLIGNTGPRVPVGKYKVAVSKWVLRDGTVPTGEKFEKAKEAGLLKNLLPEIYADHTTSPLEFEVRSGSNKIDLPLTKKQ